MFWLVVFFVALITEFFATTFLFLSLCIGAMIAFIGNQMGANLITEIVLFITFSLISLLIIKPFAKKYLHKNNVKTNVDALIEEEGIVVTEIDNVKQQGEVKCKGLVYTARAELDEVIPAGTVVQIVKIEGVKVIVRKKEQ